MAGTFYNTVTLSNFLTQNPFTVGSAGLVSVISGDGIVGTAGYAWTLINRGTVELASASGVGVDLTAGGSVTNGQSGSTGVLISGTGAGIEIRKAVGTVSNFGTIAGGYGVYLSSGTVVNAGLISGTSNYVVRVAGDGTVVNTGTITGGGRFRLMGGGSLNNSGLIASGSGIILGYGTLTNSGVIRGGVVDVAVVTNSGEIIGSTGISRVGGPVTTITNYGTIIGTSGAAVTFPSTGAATIANFGTMIGSATAVVFGAYAASDVLVLGTASVLTGTLAGFGVPDTIDLAKTQATGAVFSGTTLGGTLSVMNGTTVVETLAFSGRFPADGFAVSPDGHGGVDIAISQPTGRIIGGYYYGIVNLSNATYNSATVTSTGRVVGPTDAVIDGGAVGTLANYGTVMAPERAVYLASGGFVTNAASGGAGGYIVGGAVGVQIGSGFGTLTNSGTIAGGSGVVIAPGSNATITNSGTITGTAGTATSLGGGNNRLIVDPGAAFGGVVDGGGGASVLEIAALSGTAASRSGPSGGQGAVTSVTLGSVVNFSAAQIDPSATLDNSGVISFDTLVNQGWINVLSGASLALGTVASAAGTGAIDLQQGGTIDFKGAVANQAVIFQPPGGTAAIEQTGTFGGILSGFTAIGDIVDLTGLAGGTLAGGGTLNGGDQLVVSNATQSAILQLDTSGDYTGIIWHTSADSGTGTDLAVCFCRGTLILADRGEVPVEALAVGDRVVTVSGAFKPIRWIGFGRDLVTGKNSLARPIIVRAGALADDVPRRDLYLTHGHSLYLDGVLIPVEHLVNHRSILWDESARVVEYYHIELEDHDVLLAEGAPAESYYDAGNRALFHNARDGSAAGAAKPTCAPVLTGGEIVERLWAALYARAGGRTDADSTDDPDLHLVVDAERLDPASVADGIYTFALAAPPSRTLLLRSRGAVPSLIGLNRREHRRLGVAVRQIIFQRPGVMTCFDHDGPFLAEGGCYRPEDGHSWTDGELALPAALFGHLSGAFTLIVHTRHQAMRYPLCTITATAA